MKLRLGLLFLSATAFTCAALAQSSAKQEPVRRPDGGVGGSMESIFVPPKARAPFSLTLSTEWTRPIGTGAGTYTLVNQRRIVRDSNGRIYQERWILVPKDGNVKSWMNVFQITDPEQHTWYNCITATKVCDLYDYHFTAEEKYEPAIGNSGALPNGNGFRQHEDLGEGSTEGVETHGYRETLTINPGAMGNDAPMVSTREFWWSPQLAINLLSIVDSPQAGKQIFTVKELTTSEPDPALFNIPEEYKVVDRRHQ
jgi:hypothetical protein